MSSIMDRLRDELDELGDRVKNAVESSKLHLERGALLGQRAKTASKLGMLVYRKERGGEVRQAELDPLFAKLDDLAAKIAKVDRELDDLSGETVSVDEKPAPAATTGEAEVKDG
jgi:hypothetical protein